MKGKPEEKAKRKVTVSAIAFMIVSVLSASAIGQAGSAPIAHLQKTLAQTESSGESMSARDARARQQAAAAVELYRLGRADLVWPLLRFAPDLSLRSYIVRDLGRSGASASAVVARLRVENDVSIRRALILSLGGFTEDRFNPSERRSIVEFLLGLYRSDPDPGIHSAIEWLFGHSVQGMMPRRFDWKQENAIHAIDKELSGSSDKRRNWFLTRQGQTFVVVRGPVEFWMGSSADEPGRDKIDPEGRHRMRIPRSYAISTTEVTVGQFQRFLDANPEIKRRAEAAGNKNPTRTNPVMQRRVPEDDSPQILMTWFEAAAYCNWLSEQESIPRDQWCYPDIDKIKEGMEMPRGYLDRSGYRLPTDAEWEYACRAGTTSSRYFGWSEELLPDYGWFTGTTFNERPWPVGELKPNDLGLFDMLGNVWEWGGDEWKVYPESPPEKIFEDTEDPTLIVSKDHQRSRRGGSYTYSADFLRSAHRRNYIPDERRDSVGFRVARTIK